MSTKKSFSDLEAELQVILNRIDGASYDELDNLLADYEAGMKLIEQLEDKLKTAKNTIKKVTAGK